jgi:hypothetical protein
MGVETRRSSISRQAHQAFQMLRLAVGGFLDVALRDLGLLLGAVSLSRLAEAEERVGVPAHA